MHHFYLFLNTNSSLLDRMKLHHFVKSYIHAYLF
nr:MAG TPA: hypothetical protein [Caudoviricetes sp.]